MKRFLLYAFVLILTVAPVRADDWPQFLGPRRDGTSQEKGLLDKFAKDEPKVLWQRDVGEGYSGPIIVGEKLILFHRVGDEEVVECLHAVTAKPIWKFTYPTKYADALSKGNGPRSTPLITGDKVVTLGAEGTLTCLTLAEGKKLWSRSLTKEYKAELGYFGIGTSPIVEQDLVLVNVGAPKAGIVAFDLGDGKEAWRAVENKPSDYYPSYSSPVVCTVDGVRLAVFFTRNGAVVLDPKSGAIRYQQRWRARYAASVNAAAPLVMDNLVFFSSSYETGALLLKLKKDGADEVWTEKNVMSNHFNTCVYADGHLFGFEGRQEVGPSLRCVELKTKKVKWDQADFGAGTMILADGRLIILTESGDLCLLDATPAAFRETARVRLLDAGPCRAQIALANGRLYARDQKKLVCVQLTK
jgi:outer membrane protein assembly factor BamB